MMAGKQRRGPIYAFHSADGINWRDVSRFPVIGTRPDCPMGFLRARDGRYVAYHRNESYGRRVFRSESWDLRHWSEPKLVLEPDSGDRPLTQFYGLGSTPYGSFEIGTLWMYNVDSADPTSMSGFQEAELVYSRSGYAWHRAAQGQTFIPHGSPGTWEQGNLQCASAPVFLQDEIRYYYAATSILHSKDWELKPQRAGIGVATMRPDRFVALVAGDEEAKLVTNPFELPSTDIRVNANILEGGGLKVRLLDEHNQPLLSFGQTEGDELRGDSIDHRASWGSVPSAAELAGRKVKLEIRARRARLYAISIGDHEQNVRYNQFHSL